MLCLGIKYLKSPKSDKTKKFHQKNLWLPWINTILDKGPKCSRFYAVYQKFLVKSYLGAYPLPEGHRPPWGESLICPWTVNKTYHIFTLFGITNYFQWSLVSFVLCLVTVTASAFHLLNYLTMFCKKNTGDEYLSFPNSCQRYEVNVFLY